MDVELGSYNYGWYTPKFLLVERILGFAGLILELTMGNS
jgi:hypothetical protein